MSGRQLSDLTSLGTVAGDADELLVNDADASPSTTASKRATAKVVVQGGLAALSAGSAAASTALATAAGDTVTVAQASAAALAALSTGSPAGADRLVRHDSTTVTAIEAAEAGVLAAADVATPAAADEGLFVQSSALKKAALSSIVDKGLVAAGAASTLTPSTDKLAIVQGGALKLDTIQTVVRAELAALLGRGGLITEGASAVQAWALPAAGGVPWSNGTDLTSAVIADALASAPPTGLAWEWLTSTTARIRAGSLWTRDGLTRLALAADTTLDIATNGASGMDRKALTGTVSGTSGTRGVTGVGTAFLTEFGRRALTGTFANGGGTTTITGTGSDLRAARRVGIGDLVGNDSVGYRRVSARNFAAGTLTVSTAHGSFTGETLYVIENPTFTVTGDATLHAVDQIASDTSLTLIDNLGASPSGAAAYTGTRYGLRVFYLWLLGDGTLRLSTQRTVPFASSTGRIIHVVGLTSANILIENGSWRDGNIAWTTALASTTTTTEASPVRIALEAAGGPPCADAVKRRVYVYAAVDSAATNDSNVRAVLCSGNLTPGANVLAQATAGNVDNSEHGTFGLHTSEVPDPYGDGSYYAYLLRSSGSGGTLTGGFGCIGVGVEI